jgi:hypothetical protein
VAVEQYSDLSIRFRLVAVSDPTFRMSILLFFLIF